MSRCLAGVDSSPIPDVVLVDFLEAQEKADSVGEEKPKDEGTPARSVPEQVWTISRTIILFQSLKTPPLMSQVQGVSPGMFSSFLAGLTQAEKLQLLSDTLVETGHLVRRTLFCLCFFESLHIVQAFPAIANALTTNGHPLSCELDECEDAVREKMVIHTTRAAPQWMLCKVCNIL